MVLPLMPSRVRGGFNVALYVRYQQRELLHLLSLAICCLRCSVGLSRCLLRAGQPLVQACSIIVHARRRTPLGLPEQGTSCASRTWVETVGA